MRSFIKRNIPISFIIIVLLAVQAVFDLALPDYTARIVNIGLQQSGVEDAAPEAIRQSKMQDALLLTDQGTADFIMQHYFSVDPDSATEDQKNSYPILASEALYILKDISQSERDILGEKMAQPLIYHMGIVMNSPETEAIREMILQSLPPGSVSEDSSLMDLLRILPADVREELFSKVSDAVPAFTGSQLVQAAIQIVVEEYKTIGIDVGGRQMRFIIFAGLSMLGISLLSIGAAIFVTFFAARLAAALGKKLREQIFGRVLRFSPNDLEEFGTSSLITRSTNDIQQVQMLVVMMFRLVVYAPILGVYGFIKVLSTDASMSWIIGVGVLAMSVLISVLFIFAMPKFRIMQKLVDKLNLVSREILTGLPVIRAFANAPHEEKRFDKANHDLTSVNLFVNRTMAIMMPTMMLVMNAITLLVVWVGAESVNAGAMQVGDMMAFMQYAMQVIMAFLMISMVSIILPRASVSVKRIREVLKKEPSVHDPSGPELQAFSTDNDVALEFKDVYFRYPGAEEDVLRNISFQARTGQTTAIIGSTGSGKSTLINLIPRFFDVTGGKVLVAGTDIRNVTQKSLREKIGLVPQKGVLFSGTIASNIKLGAEDADEDAVKRAARIAQAADFIEEKDDGYDNEISQGGTNVSGGQRQRLAIARAIAKNPDIYVFDDSFSALDYKTDRTLRETLKKELANATIIIVTQRISTIMQADQIIVLDEGEIAGIGKHKELLKSCDVYYQIATSQMSQEELAL